MRLALQIQLLPDGDQSIRLRKTVERFNEAANWLAGHAFDRGVTNKFLLGKLYYYEVRERFGLSADTTIRCIAQVCEAYSRNKEKRPLFRRLAAVPFSIDKNIGFKSGDRVSVSTLTGRCVFPFVMGRHQRSMFGFEKGQCDLIVRRDGKWFLSVSVRVPECEPSAASDLVGVDLGVSNIVATSDGEVASADHIERQRVKYFNIRWRLGKKMGRCHKRRTRKNARRAMKRIGQKESRYRRDVNHCISKRLVALAKGTKRGIALEDLKGIRSRIRFRKRQRARMGGWSFYQLRTFITYKGRLHGVPVVVVDPRNTSRTCNACGHCDKSNRKSQSEFVCVGCGHNCHADINAARNIRAKALADAPQVPEPSQKIVTQYGHESPSCDIRPPDSRLDAALAATPESKEGEGTR